jgi:hypothetical protein
MLLEQILKDVAEGEDEVLSEKDMVWVGHSEYK